jgi:hypothetical protein
MIVTNWTAHLVVWFFSKITPDTWAVTLGWWIFIWPWCHATDERLIRHEQVHLRQWKRYWMVGFPFIYIYYHLKYGYQNNPLEIEARKEE